MVPATATQVSQRQRREGSRPVGNSAKGAYTSRKNEAMNAVSENIHARRATADVGV